MVGFDRLQLKKGQCWHHPCLCQEHDHDTLMSSKAITQIYLNAYFDQEEL